MRTRRVSQEQNVTVHPQLLVLVGVATASAGIIYLYWGQAAGYVRGRVSARLKIFSPPPQQSSMKTGFFAGKMRAGGLVLAAVLAGSQVERADAAVLTWTAATPISGDSDVDTSGSLVAAFNAGAAGVGDATVNGVLFQGLAVSGDSATSGDFTLQTTSGNFAAGNSFGSSSDPFNSLSASYKTLLSSIVGTPSIDPFSLTMNNLTSGLSYEFQVWSCASSTPASLTLTVTAGNSVTLASRNPDTTGAVGQFAIGSFVADSTTQVIDFEGPTTRVINGFQLRAVSPVPEPAETTAVVAGLLGLGCCVRKLRRRLA